MALNIWAEGSNPRHPIRNNRRFEEVIVLARSLTPKSESGLIPNILQEITDKLVRMFKAGQPNAINLFSSPYPALDHYLRSQYLPQNLSATSYSCDQFAFLIARSPWPDILLAAAELKDKRDHILIIITVAHINAWQICQS